MLNITIIRVCLPSKMCQFWKKILILTISSWIIIWRLRRIVMWLLIMRVFRIIKIIILIIIRGINNSKSLFNSSRNTIFLISFNSKLRGILAIFCRKNGVFLVWMVKFNSNNISNNNSSKNKEIISIEVLTWLLWVLAKFSRVKGYLTLVVWRGILSLITI